MSMTLTPSNGPIFGISEILRGAPILRLTSAACPARSRPGGVWAHPNRQDARALDTAAHSRDANRPGFTLSFAPKTQRAQGMPDAWRARSLVCNEKKHTS